MQKIVLFIEPCGTPSCFPSKIGDLIMNRFAIDESAGFEILKIFQLETTYNQVFFGDLRNPGSKKNQGLDS